MTEPTVDATAEEVGSEVVVIPQPATLFKTDDPAEVLAKASEVATALKETVQKAGLIATIKGKEHPKVEAWQLLGSMLGVSPVPLGEPKVIPWPEPIPPALKAIHDRGLSFGFSAAYNAVKAGEIVGGGQARCLRTEYSWKDRDDFALASMAQTRAISKTLSGPLRFVMVLAGYDATPAEEMGAPDPPARREQVRPTDGATPRQANGVSERPLSAEQRSRLIAAIMDKNEEPGYLDLLLATVGKERIEDLTNKDAKQIAQILSA
jgi:hypothetical protein